MKKTIVLLSLFFIYAVPCFAEGVENGKYELSFRISDMGFSQIIEIKNSTQNTDISYYKFDVVIKEKGSLKRFDDDNQIIKGIAYDGKFKFIIPYANVVSIDAFYFEGKNKLEDGIFTGTGDVPYQGPNVGNNKFNFVLTKINP